MILDVRDLMEADAHAAGVPIKLRLGDGLSPVRADAIQLQQVLLNLTRNAVDAMRDGPERRRGIIVATEPSTDGGIRVMVTDHGPGVAKSLAENIFHPFVTTKSTGLGVGLAISRTIVQAFGGTLDYEDNPEGGAIFCVELPPAREGGRE